MEAERRGRQNGGKTAGKNGGTETDWRVTRRVSIHYVYSLRYRATDGRVDQVQITRSPPSELVHLIMTKGPFRRFHPSNRVAGGRLAGWNTDSNLIRVPSSAVSIPQNQELVITITSQNSHLTVIAITL